MTIVVNRLGLSLPTGDPNNPLQRGPDWAGAWQYNTQQASDFIQRQRQQSVDMGLWDPVADRPTAKGMIAAAQGYGNALLMGTTAPKEPFKLYPDNLKLPDHLTQTERNAVSQYASSSPWVNGPAPEAEPVRKALDSAIDKSELGDSAILYRGFGANPDLVKNLDVGNVVPLSAGHVSTSLSRDTAQGFADDLYSPDETSVLVKIHAPSGTKALAVPTAPELERDPDNPVSQQEILLPRGMQFRITGKHEVSDGRLELTARPHVGD